ncbi:GNAT family N-acetyltransferase [Ottowia testudinis]|uniref:GNAT family N-acetyltransferase n=1 Tax=Ottowia testudinis TaxID=2816950 RepID=UPI003D653CA0
MRREYLAALHASGSAVPSTGWAPRFALLWDGAELAAACPLYLKSHSYGEYVFDWAWANAYAEHGLRYYPKALVAVPFTPVPGSRLLARDAGARAALAQALVHWCGEQKLSSLHVLFGDDADLAACGAAGLMQRQQVQFHWKNVAPPRSPAARGALPPEGARPPWDGPAAGDLVPPRSPAARGALPPEGARPPWDGPAAGGLAASTRFTDFDDFLASLTQDKRKKIRQERRKVQDAGVRFRSGRGGAIAAEDWAFFYRCYERTYLEHGNAPYLAPAFFAAMARDMAEDWVLFIAERDGQPIASSLIAVGACPTSARGQNGLAEVAYGRYWGALARVDCLHFEACYYQPIDWCIRHGVARFEGGAQGEHKMARALMPVTTHSAHWLAHPAFADAVERFLVRESAGIEGYLDHLGERSPFRQTPPA